MRQAPDAGTARRAIGEYLRRAALVIGGFIVLIWAVWLVNALFFQGALFAFGIRPRTIDGLIGLPAHPLLHGDVPHLVHNTIGIALFGTLVYLREERDFWIVTLLGALLGGLGVWVFARPLVHIGASSVIFAYFGYLVSTGLFERRIGSLLLSIVVFLAWGWVLLGVLPFQSGISWEGHLFGFLSGVVAARALSRTRTRAAAR